MSFDIDCWRNLDQEPLKGLDITQQLRSILDREELFLILYEFGGQIELVIGTRGQTSLVDDLRCRHAERSLAPVQEIAALEITTNVCPVGRQSRSCGQHCLVRPSGRYEDRQQIDSTRKSDNEHEAMSCRQNDPAQHSRPPIQ